MKAWAFIWLLLVVAVGASLGWKVCTAGVKFDTNILTLLPATEQDPVVEQAVNEFSQDLGKRVIFLVGSADAEIARAAADRLVEVCGNAPNVEQITAKRDGGEGKAFYEFYSPHVASLLGEESVFLLNAGEAGVGEFLEQSVAMLFSPLGSSLSQALSSDPLLLFPQWIQSRIAVMGQGGVNEGYIEVDYQGRTHVLVDATLSHSPFDRKWQRSDISLVHGLLAELRQTFPDLTVKKAGAIFYAHAGSESAEKEIQTIGLGSSIGILLLVLFAFRSFRYVALSLLPIAVGFLFAMTASVLWFPRVHLITLGFGASLIGVCIDYAFHFFSDCTGEEGLIEGPEVLRAIGPGVTLGMLTSLLAYAGLYVAPFPGLQQMAVFSSVGLLGAFGTVLAWYPAFLHGRASAPSSPFLMKVVFGVLLFWSQAKSKPSFKVVFAGVTLVVMAGILFLHPDDDVRQLQEMPAHLKAEERDIQDRMGRGAMGSFLLVKGSRPEEVLTVEEKARDRLDRWIADGRLTGYQAVSQWVPSQEKQQRSRDAFRRGLLGGPERLSAHFDQYGFPASAMSVLKESVSQDPASITVDRWLAHPASAAFRHMWMGEIEGAWFSLILLEGLSASANGSEMETVPGVSYINKVEDITDIFRRYRHLASWIIFGVYLLIGVLLLFRYGLRKGIQVFLPPCLAAAWTLGILGYLNQPLTLFHVLALLLVLGIGIDYTLFFAEARSHVSKIVLAIMLSSCTTLLAFGLLALSQTAALRNFGLTILIGIACALLFAPMAASTRCRP